VIKGIAFDVETTSLNPRKGELRCIGHENSDGQIFVVRTGLDRNIESPWSIHTIGDNVLIGANIHFDLQWFLEDRELLDVRVHDVQFMHYLTDESYPIRGLKHLFRLYTKYEDYEPETRPDLLSDEDF